MVKYLLDALEIRSSDDRRGFCLGVFHRLSSLRAGQLRNAGSNRFFVEIGESLWQWFREDKDFEDLSGMYGEIMEHYPKEDEPAEFDLDMFAVLCFAEIARAVATPHCTIVPDIIDYFTETVEGTAQLLLGPGVVTDELRSRVAGYPQVRQELNFLNVLLDHAKGLSNATARLEFESWVKNACIGDLWRSVR